MYGVQIGVERERCKNCILSGIYNQLEVILLFINKQTVKCEILKNCIQVLTSCFVVDSQRCQQCVDNICKWNYI
jgi:hypothetical protein